ncbi:MAG: glutamate-1-semialdehyde 2,1-aminomutase [Leptospiraceae bacterium]|nr:glutamate-1-semialdehyde 2,1-aminomutase [Leptospiraceae bacterium]
MNRSRSEELYRRALKVLPGGVNSPVRAFRSVGGTPVFMESGQGCEIKDVDGNTYIDFCNSWGPLISGHRHPDILRAVQRQLEKSMTLGIPTESEVELAEYILGKIKTSLPGIQKIRFVSSGTEAVMSAVRLARGFTRRNKIIKFEGCYHGHSDALLVKAGSGLVTAGIPDSSGVPEAMTSDIIVLPLDDENAVQEVFARQGDEIAAIILEPVPANNGLLIQREEYLQFLRKITRENGALLIFDEVINGFRLAFGGAAEYLRIEPDLITYGKIIGGGLPVGAFAGRNDIFALLAPDGPVYQAGTLSGNPVAMAAGLAQLKLLDDALYTNLENKREKLQSAFNQKGFAFNMTGIGSIFWFYQGQTPPRRPDLIDRESMKTYARMFHFCLDRGIYLAPSGYEVGFLSAAMEDSHLQRFLDTVCEFFEKEVANGK